MKKILAFILSASMLLGITAPISAAYTDVDASFDCYASAMRLRDLGIIAGYEDNSFRPNNAITRAEFTKIIICMMDKEAEAMASSVSTGFYDVPNNVWYAPYIRYAAQKDILSGYADGSFAPDKTITFAEAVTVLLRTLGYTEESVGYFWPDNYLTSASSLSVTNGISLNPNDAITRGIAAILVDRALFTKPSNIQTANDTYLETVGYTVLKDALILETDTKSDNATVLAGNMKQNNASTYIEQTEFPLYSGDIYNFAVIDRQGYLKTVRKYEFQSNICSVTGAINKLTENTIEYTTVDGLKSSFRADDNFIIYSDGSRYAFAMAKDKITAGADITFYGNTYGMWNIAVIGGNNSVEPVLIGNSFNTDEPYIGNIPVNTANLTIYRNGKSSSLSEIKAGDVVYYNTKTNVMDVYTKKVTGTYYAAYPSKAYVDSVSVAGKTYSIGYSAATSKLDASEGAFEIGDKLTLILGKDDKVVFVSDTSSAFDYSIYGVVLGSDIKLATAGENEGSSEYVTSVFMSDGETHDIVTNKLYKDYIGAFVRISYANGVASLSKQSNSNKDDFAGKIDSANRSVNGHYFLKDAAIIQLNPDNSCELINFDTISKTKLEEENIINAVTANGFGDIAILFVKDFENTSDFGIITSISDMGYTIFSNGKKMTYSRANILSISTSVCAGVQFKASGNALTSILPLQKLNTTSKLTAVDNSRIKIGNAIYNIDDNAQVFDITDRNSIKSITIDDLTEKNVTSVSVYSDKRTNGTIKIIAVSIDK